MVNDGKELSIYPTSPIQTNHHVNFSKYEELFLTSIQNMKYFYIPNNKWRKKPIKLDYHLLQLLINGSRALGSSCNITKRNKPGTIYFQQEENQTPLSTLAKKTKTKKPNLNLITLPASTINSQEIQRPKDHINCTTEMQSAKSTKTL